MVAESRDQCRPAALGVRDAETTWLSGPAGVDLEAVVRTTEGGAGTPISRPRRRSVLERQLGPNRLAGGWGPHGGCGRARFQDRRYSTGGREGARGTNRALSPAAESLSKCGGPHGSVAR